MKLKELDDWRTDNFRTFIFWRVKKLPKFITKIKGLVPPSKYKSWTLEEYYNAFVINFEALKIVFRYFEVDLPE